MDEWKIALIVALANILLGFVGQLAGLIIKKFRQKYLDLE